MAFMNFTRHQRPITRNKCAVVRVIVCAVVHVCNCLVSFTSLTTDVWVSIMTISSIGVLVSNIKDFLF